MRHMTGTNPGAGRPLRQDAARNRQLLVLAARDVFHRKGLESPLEEIAKQAGVSIGTLYNRFPSRGELVDAALGPVAEQSVEIAEQALRADDPWDGFADYLRGMCELIAAERGYTDVYRMRIDDTPVIDAARERMGLLKTRIMERAKAAGSLRDDVESTDVILLIWGIAGIIDATRAAAPHAWRRHLALTLDALRPAAANPLPAPALTDRQILEATPPR
jgi:AcrR family transcriptional regulator